MFRRHQIASAIGGLGVLVIAAHLALGIAAVGTAAQTGSGVVIGLVLLGGAALHIALSRRSA